MGLRPGNEGLPARGPGGEGGTGRRANRRDGAEGAGRPGAQRPRTPRDGGRVAHVRHRGSGSGSPKGRDRCPTQGAQRVHLHVARTGQRHRRARRRVGNSVWLEMAALRTGRVSQCTGRKDLRQMFQAAMIGRRN